MEIKGKKAQKPEASVPADIAIELSAFNKYYTFPGKGNVLFGIQYAELEKAGIEIDRSNPLDIDDDVIMSFISTCVPEPATGKDKDGKEYAILDNGSGRQYHWCKARKAALGTKTLTLKRSALNMSTSQPNLYEFQQEADIDLTF